MPDSQGWFLKVQKLPNGQLKMDWGGNLSAAEATWCMDEVKTQLHNKMRGGQGTASVQLPGVDPRHV